MKLLRRLLSLRQRWMTIASYGALRAAGFVIGLFLSRYVGADALGLYYVTSTTALTAATALALSITGMAASAGLEAKNHAAEAGTRLGATTILAVAFAIMAAGIFVVLLTISIDGKVGGLTRVSLLAAGAIAAFAHVLGTARMAFLQGFGLVSLVAQVSFWAGLGTLACAVVLVPQFGIVAAVALFAAMTLAQAIAATVIEGGQPLSLSRAALRQIGERAHDVLGGLGAVVINSAVNWYCMVYLLLNHYGAAGQGAYAAALQWTTLMLIPVNAWFPITLRNALEAARGGERATLRRSLWVELARNAGVTSAIAVVVAALAHPIASLYRMPVALPALLWIGCLVAVSNAMYYTLERFYSATVAQARWMLLTAVGFAVQLAFTAALIGRGLWVVPVGVLLSFVVNFAVGLVLFLREAAGARSPTEVAMLPGEDKQTLELGADGR